MLLLLWLHYGVTCCKTGLIKSVWMEKMSRQVLGEKERQRSHQGLYKTHSQEVPTPRQSPVQENGGQLHLSQFYSAFCVLIWSPRYPCLRQNTARGICSLGTLRFSHKDFHSLSILGTFHGLGGNKNEATSAHIIYLWSYYKSANNLETETLPIAVPTSPEGEAVAECRKVALLLNQEIKLWRLNLSQIYGKKLSSL